MNAATHPAWCLHDSSCEDGTHWAEPATFEVEDGLRAEVLLSQSSADVAPVPYIDIAGDGVIALDRIEALGHWLLEQTAKLRQTIAAEGGAR